jgi:hypothetical protein
MLLALLPGYRLAGSVDNVTLTFSLPAFTGISLTDRDVVLARDDVEITAAPIARNYTDIVEFSVLSSPVLFARGFVAVDVRIDGIPYRFVNTHLESADSGIRLQQARELTAFLDNSAVPVILVGDFNSSAPHGASYQHILSEKFVDVWTRNKLRRGYHEGYTSSHAKNLQNDSVSLSSRIDIVFARNQAGKQNNPGIGPVAAYLVGDQLEDRIAIPDADIFLWPSDHAGVVARLQLPIQRAKSVRRQVVTD